MYMEVIMKSITKMFNNQKIRVIIKNGDPYFNAQDVCYNLGLSNTSQSISTLEKVGPVIRENNGFIDKYIGDAMI